MGFSLQYNYCIVHKEYSKWKIECTFDGTNVRYPASPSNDEKGCISIDSIQTIENQPVNFNRDGLNGVYGGTVRDERNVKVLSRRINKSLLAESNKDKAVSVEYNNKYLLALNSKVYVFDFNIKVMDDIEQILVPICYPWSNVPASCFLVKDGLLYFGGTDGLIYRFKTYDEPMPYNDENTSIISYWKSKLINFNSPNRYKDVPNINYYMQPLTRASANLTYLTESEYGDIDNTQMDLLNFGDMDFARTSFLTTWYPQPVPVPSRIRKCNLLQLKFENKNADEGMKITGADLQYSIGSEVR
jgi:hypothetical protein